MEESLHKFRVHSFDADAFGVVTAPRLLGYLVESAGASADALGFGIHQFHQRGLTWVLGRIRIVMDQVLSFGEELVIETWPSGLERLVATREFRVLKDGQVAGCATSLWFVLDMKTRQPVRPQRLIPERLQPQTPHLIALSKAIPSLPQPTTLQRQYDVRKSDIDFNRHATAGSYVVWAMEAVPEELWLSSRLASLDVQFMEECHLGTTVVSESSLVEGGSVLHRISRKSDGKELARLSTLWVGR